MTNIWMLILGMSLVTYVPRVLPFFMVRDQELSKDVKLFLDTVPYASLGALILPGGIGAISHEPLISVVGLLVAFLIALWKNHIIGTILGSIFIVSVLLYLF